MARNYANRASDGRRSRNRRFGALDGDLIPVSRATELLELAEKSGVSTSNIPRDWKHAARDVTRYSSKPHPSFGTLSPESLARLRGIPMNEDNAIEIRHPDTVSMMPIQIENASQALQRQLALYDTINHLVDTKFIPDVDYGIIPGTKKNSLLKPGIEKIMGLLGLRSNFKTLNVIRDTDRDNPFFYFEVEVELIHIQSDMIVAVGQGSCNSRESRFMRTQDRTCPTCGKETIRKSATNWYCWAKLDGCGAQFGLKDERLTSQTVGNVFDAQLVWNNVSNILKQANKRAEIAAVNEVAMLSGKFASMAINANGQQSGQNHSPQPSAQQRPPNNPAPSASQNTSQPASQKEDEKKTWLHNEGQKEEVIAELNKLGLTKEAYLDIDPQATGWNDIALKNSKRQLFKKLEELAARQSAVETTLITLHIKSGTQGKNNYTFTTSDNQTVTAFTREPFRQAGWIASGSWEKTTSEPSPLPEPIPVTLIKPVSGYWQIDAVHPAPDFFAEDKQDTPKPNTPSAPLPTVYGKPASKPETPAVPKWADAKFFDQVEMIAAMTADKALNEMERTGWHEFASIDEALKAVDGLAHNLPDLRNEAVDEEDRYADVPF